MFNIYIYMYNIYVFPVQIYLALKDFHNVLISSVF